MKHCLVFVFLMFTIFCSAQTIIPPSNVILHSDGNNAYLTYDLVPGALGYRIEKSSSPNGAYTTVGYSFTNTYSVGQRDANTMQFYRVVSIGPVDPNQNILQPETVVVDENFQNAILFMTDSYIVLDRNRVLILNFSVDEVLVSGPFIQAPDGFMRKITEVESHNNYVVLRTIPANLSEVYSEAEIQTVKQLTADDIESTEYFYRGISCGRSTNSRYIITYPFDNCSVSLGNGQNIVLNGNFHLTPDFMMDTKIHNFRLTQAQFQVGFHGEAELTATSATAGIEVTGEVTLLKHVFHSITISTTPYIAVTPVLELKLKVSYNGVNNPTISFEENFNYQAGLVYENSQWRPYTVGDIHISYNPPEMGYYSVVSAGIGPALSLKLYGIVGPYFEAIGGCETITNINEDPWETGNVSITGSIGVNLKVFAFELDSGTFDLDIYHETLFEKHRVKKPVITPVSGIYNNAQLISILCDTPNIQLRFTTDGSDPNESSQLYSGPFLLNISATVLARGFKPYYTPSDTTRAVYELVCATPVVSPSGGSYSNSVSVSMNCPTENVQIRYTLNGSEPSITSSLYEGLFTINSSCTLKAKAFRNGWTTSAIATEVYIISVSSPQFVFVQGGTFNNGTSDVTVSSFYLDKYELTQLEYQAVMGVNPSYFSVVNGPVEQVSWFNAIEYCNKRSINEGLTPCYSYLTYGTNTALWPSVWNTSDDNHTNVYCSWTANGYRLPTEAEWEFAARGGTSSHGYNYSGSNDINAVGWYAINSSNTTHTIGNKSANELGLFDMSGNVWEWNWDIYGTYPSGAQTNPYGADSGSIRVWRGGSLVTDASYCTVSGRGGFSMIYCGYHIGFRVCRSSTDNMVFISGGTFNNGTSDVTVSSFYLDKYELTQSKYQAVMGVNPSYDYGVGSDYPVYYVSWYDAIAYCNKRSIREGLAPCYDYSTYGTNPTNWPPGWNSDNNNHTNVSCNWTADGYRLPTESEWEFAARGGNLSHNYTYSGGNNVNDVGWWGYYYGGNSGYGTNIVGQKLPNELGIFDMTGNIWEWNWDICGDFSLGTQYNPTGALSGSTRAIRGACWEDALDKCSVSFRYIWGEAANIGNALGFRICRNSP